MTAKTVSVFCLVGLLVVAALIALPQPPSNPSAPTVRPARPAESFESIVLGASLFRAAWGYRQDRAWLESQLDYLSRHGFNAIRALGTVGDPNEPDYWDGREIDWRWEDYDRVIAGLTDLAFDKYGLRVQWTIFADAQRHTPDEEDRARLIERFIAMSRGRERKILAFEVANEYWQNGFDGAEGLKQLAAFARRLNEATPIPVAASSHEEALCGLYGAGAVDFATIHFDRNAPQARWTPLEQPWRAARRARNLWSCEMPEIASNNEPIGPGSSVSSTVEPVSVVMSAVNTYLSGLPIYILHSGPGVRDDPANAAGLRPSRFDQLPQAEVLFGAMAAVRNYLPADVFTWTPLLRGSQSFPFEIQGEAPVVLGVERDRRFVIGISGTGESSRLIARAPMRVRAIDPLTGRGDSRDMAPGDRLPVNAAAIVLDGSRLP